MAESLTTLRSLPWWVAVLGVWLVSRIVSTTLILMSANAQAANAWTDAQPDIWDYSTMWDAHWYFIVHMVGYPTELPLDEAGHVAENAWAFMPVYPTVVGALRTVTNAPWEVAAVLVSLAASAGFALVAYRLFRAILPHGALFAVALVCCSPTSPMLQFGYAESLHLLLLAAALLAWTRRDWAWLTVLIPVMAMTRPSGLAFSFALALAALAAWWPRRREGLRAVPRAELLLAVWAGLWGLAWPALAWVTTGDLTAYTDTELAWRSDYIGRVELVPFTPWIQGFAWWFGDGWGPVLLLAMLAASVLLCRTPSARAMAPVARWWVIAYGAYLLAVFFPQSSTFRLLMPMFPVAGALAIPRHPAYRVVLVIASIVGQWVWLSACWHVDGADWTPP